MRRLKVIAVNILHRVIPIPALALSAAVSVADSTDAACEVYPRGEDHTDVLISASDKAISLLSGLTE